MFTAGRKVEVSFEGESLRDCWLPATLLKNYGNNTFLVEYQQPGAGDEVILHEATVDHLHIRPSPPHLGDKHFLLLEKVDAYYDFGWWSGVITKELADNRYTVFFKHTNKDIEFVHSRVRPHLEWKGGKWFNTSQGEMDERTTLEQTSPSISKLVIKRAMQNNQDSNDKGSTPSKKLKDLDEIMNDDSSKKTSVPSVGQSEGVVSEVSGTTNQPFSKTENPFSGKNEDNKLEKCITRTDSPEKGGRLSNELRSLQVSDKETQEIVGKADITEGFIVPVVLGSQCDEITVSQDKKLQNPSTEKTANATGTGTQGSVPLPPLTVTEKGSEGGAASVAPKRKRGRPPKLRVSSPETPANNPKDVPSALPMVEVGQKKAGLTTGLVTEVVEEFQLPDYIREQAGMQTSPLSNGTPSSGNTRQDLGAQPGQGMKPYVGRRGRRRTISLNTESSAQDSQDGTPEASVGKSPDTVSDDQPISSHFEGKQSSIAVSCPDGTVEPSSEVSERQLEIGGMDSENVPFVRSTSLWKTLESTDAFRTLPQKPHFRPLESEKQIAREGLAIGTMVTFSTVVDRTCGMKLDEPRTTIEDFLATLVELENNGFDVEVIRQRLRRLLLIKDKHEELTGQSKVIIEKREEHCVQVENFDQEIEEIDRQMRELVEKREQALLKMEKGESEFVAMDVKFTEIEQQIRGLGAEFDELVAAPL